MKRIKFTVFSVIVLVLCLCQSIAFATTLDVAEQVGTKEMSDFWDIDETHWAYSSISDMVSRGVYLDGTSNQILPYSPLTRAECVNLMSKNMRGIGGGISESPQYLDVSPYDWFAGSVEWSRNIKMSNGVGNMCFSPNTNVTKEQIVKMLYNFTVNNGVTLILSDVPCQIVSDLTTGSDWATEALIWGGNLNLLTLDTDDAFSPCADASRSDYYDIVFKYNKLVSKGEYTRLT